MHWRSNLVLVPFDSAGNAFVQELTHLLMGFAEGSSLECISMNAITLVQVLMLQKPSKRSKIKDHISHLSRRLGLWKEGEIEELMDEEGTFKHA